MMSAMDLRPGSLTGSVSAATNPSVTMVLELTPDWCPHEIETFTGTYDGGTGRLSVAGDVVLRGWGCDGIASFPERQLTLRR